MVGGQGRWVERWVGRSSGSTEEEPVVGDKTGEEIEDEEMVEVY